MKQLCIDCHNLPTSPGGYKEREELWIPTIALQHPGLGRPPTLQLRQLHITYCCSCGELILLDTTVADLKEPGPITPVLVEEEGKSEEG
jgi:hypothetical protein